MSEATEWSVWRWSGRAADEWRKLMSGAKEKAVSRYMRERERMRQGGLIIKDGERPVAREWAPRLRTKW